MSVLIEFPKQAEFGRVLPKSKIYEHASPSSKVKELFIQSVGKIIWSYKLSPETVNLPAKNEVQEIQIFTVILKTEKLKYEVLQTIDKAILSPIIFALTFKGKTRYVAAYKRPSEADKNKWVVSNYFETEWMKNDSNKIELPITLNLTALYHEIFKKIIPLPAKQEEPIAEHVFRAEQLQIKEREADKVKARIKKEKQFNRKVEINATLKNLQSEIEELQS
jgi:hypothetical protein